MILLLDNYDSFTWNIVQHLGESGYPTRVVRSDRITVEQIGEMNPGALILSPGPGGPEDAGVCCDAVRSFAGKVPILGICLGHQCIARVFGARIIRSENLVHGWTDRIFHDGKTIYDGLRNPFTATPPQALLMLLP